MAKHTAWNTFRETDPNRKPQRQPAHEFSMPSFKCSSKNIEKWVAEECIVCKGEFDEGQIVCELGTALVHGKCV